MEPSTPSVDDDDPERRGSGRRRAAVSIAPFLALGLGHLVTLFFWGVDPLWAFAILPPILAVTAIAWVAFRHGFDRRPRETSRNRPD
ncbi:hypothetical protein [Halopiger djelfimassiliensis]|uniref:hypothetical protein n=1 Tax=Halopiger djelfimassiliensis TaxID=1293047 RepID=UPI000677F828|nr:hypothetical protein [Halopiger djelfimassiliensis]